MKTRKQKSTPLQRTHLFSLPRIDRRRQSTHKYYSQLIKPPSTNKMKYTNISDAQQTGGLPQGIRNIKKQAIPEHRTTNKQIEPRYHKNNKNIDRNNSLQLTKKTMGNNYRHNKEKQVPAQTPNPQQQLGQEDDEWEQKPFAEKLMLEDIVIDLFYSNIKPQQKEIDYTERVMRKDSKLQATMLGRRYTQQFF